MMGWGDLHESYIAPASHCEAMVQYTNAKEKKVSPEINATTSTSYPSLYFPLLTIPPSPLTSQPQEGGDRGITASTSKQKKPLN